MSYSSQAAASASGRAAAHDPRPQRGTTAGRRSARPGGNTPACRVGRPEAAAGASHCEDEREAAPEGFDCLGNAIAKVGKHPRALFAAKLTPLFEPEVLRLATFYPRLVAEHPQKREVGIDLALHHGFQVELNVSLAGERDIIAEDAEHQAVGKEAPRLSSRRLRNSCIIECGLAVAAPRHPWCVDPGEDCNR